MARLFWVDPLQWITGDATAVANSTSEALLVPVLPFVANYFQDGRRVRMTLFGKLSTTGTPTITFRVRLGAVGSGLTGDLLALSEALTMGSGVTNVNWDMDIEIQTRTNGASGAVLCRGVVRVHTAAGTVVMNVFGVSGYDAPAAVTVDLTAAKDLAVTAQWSAASASNTATCMDAYAEASN